MNVRRCACVFFESRETASFDLAGLLAGGVGVARTRRWLALAPHLEQEIEVSEAEMTWLGRFSPQLWSMADAMPEDILGKITASIPSGRLGQPSDIARTVAFLSDDAAGYITGANI